MQRACLPNSLARLVDGRCAGIGALAEAVQDARAQIGQPGVLGKSRDGLAQFIALPFGPVAALADPRLDGARIVGPGGDPPRGPVDHLARPDRAGHAGAAAKRGELRRRGRGRRPVVVDPQLSLVLRPRAHVQLLDAVGGRAGEEADRRFVFEIGPQVAVDRRVPEQRSRRRGVGEHLCGQQRQRMFDAEAFEIVGDLAPAICVSIQRKSGANGACDPITAMSNLFMFQMTK